MKHTHGEDAWEIARDNKKREGRNGTYGHVPRFLNGRDILGTDADRPDSEELPARSYDSSPRSQSDGTPLCITLLTLVFRE